MSRKMTAQLYFFRHRLYLGATLWSYSHLPPKAPKVALRVQAKKVP